MRGHRACVLVAIAQLTTTSLVAQVSKPAKPGFDYRTRIGIAGTGHGTTCLAIQASQLPAGTPVALVWVPAVGEKGQPSVLRAETMTRDSSACPMDVGPEFGEYEDTRYPVRLVRGQLDSTAFYFGVLAPAEQLRIRGRSIVGALDKTASRTTFRACTTNEGLHLTVWRGEPLIGRRVWHRYVHFEYDTRMLCRGPDYRQEK